MHSVAPRRKYGSALVCALTGFFVFSAAALDTVIEPTPDALSAITSSSDARPIEEDHLASASCRSNPSTIALAYRNYAARPPSIRSIDINGAAISDADLAKLSAEIGEFSYLHAASLYCSGGNWLVDIYASKVRAEKGDLPQYDTRLSVLFIQGKLNSLSKESAP